jgi:hypothetical protein
MSGPLLCSFAWRVSAYNGVMYARIESERQRRSKTADGRPREYVSNERAQQLVKDEGVFETVSDG